MGRIIETPPAFSEKKLSQSSTPQPNDKLCHQKGGDRRTFVTRIGFTHGHANAHPVKDMTMERFLKRTARLLDGQAAWQGDTGFRVGNVKAVDDRINVRG